MLLLDADSLRDVLGGQVRGQAHDRADLDAMLTDVARRVAAQRAPTPASP